MSPKIPASTAGTGTTPLTLVGVDTLNRVATGTEARPSRVRALVARGLVSEASGKLVKAGKTAHADCAAVSGLIDAATTRGLKNYRDHA